MIWIAVAIYLNSLNQPQCEVCLKYGDEDKSVKSLRMPTTPDFRQILIRKGILMSLWLKWAKASRDYINYILGSFYFYFANICSILDNFLVKIYELLKIKAHHIHVACKTVGLSSCRTIQKFVDWVRVHSWNFEHLSLYIIF